MEFSKGFRDQLIALDYQSGPGIIIRLLISKGGKQVSRDQKRRFMTEAVVRDRET